MGEFEWAEAYCDKCAEPLYEVHVVGHTNPIKIFCVTHGVRTVPQLRTVPKFDSVDEADRWLKSG